jgi:hypothetical protein
VKLLHVKQNAKLSLQMYHHRSEHWVVVKGAALVTRSEESKIISEISPSLFLLLKGTGWKIPEKCRSRLSRSSWVSI